ncbi:MlaE family ABC transporter permease [Synoicihabitans lomoniglobus]|uniref:ABC transporter permease n=1 Tax=Synoicihabitans lomoniglobus TaxID=2909285 RepID=A0AAE9ZYC4_9BACT|nr:ABC transporter permease [Opitutaceae bacterium LMO-M01]WED65290.1 ABC transporter permease [Opitutaceae bacterium LMO-M01]
MSSPLDQPAPTARLDVSADNLRVQLGGDWRITVSAPRWDELVKDTKPARVDFETSDLQGWDSSLVLFIWAASNWCRVHGVYCNQADLPAALGELVGRLEDRTCHPIPTGRPPDFLSAVGNATIDLWEKAKQYSNFVGECVISSGYLARHPQKFRWRDCIAEMQRCGAMALPITGLIAFLVGVILAYSGAVILRQFGGDIWVADLVGVTMTREMGAMMTAIVVAGRTGASFAAEIGNMRANEEVDALVTLGIRPVDFLVIPRIVALGVMMPLLAVYANSLGIFGGMMIAWGLLDIPPTAYWVELLTIVDTSDLMTGIIKAATFGAIIGLAGCLRGLQADRSASGVGQAATSAVVTAILLIIVSDAVYAVVFNILGW